MNNTISRQSAFRTISSMRQSSSRAKKKFMVSSLNKDGSVSKMAKTANDWRHNAFESMEDAETRRDALHEMNPGRSFTIVAL